MSRLVLVHGFTQTGASWDALAGELRADGHEVVTPDLATGHDLWDAARQLGEDGGDAIYIGYSMGGRVALHLALAEPARVDGLVLVGATAGIDDDAERRARRAADEALAATIEADGADAFLDRWLAQRMFAGLPDDAREGRCRDVGALATSLRSLGTGTQDVLWDRLAALDVPALVLAGEHDAKFRALAERLAGALPRGQVAIIPGAGHAAHLERPDAFLQLLRAWLASH